MNVFGPMKKGKEDHSPWFFGMEPSLPVASYPWWGHLGARACVSAVVPPDGLFGRSQSPIQVMAICSEKWVPFQCVLPRTLWPGSHWEGSQEN